MAPPVDDHQLGVGNELNQGPRLVKMHHVVLVSPQNVDREMGHGAHLGIILVESRQREVPQGGNVSAHESWAVLDLVPADVWWFELVMGLNWWFRIPLIDRKSPKLLPMIFLGKPVEQSLKLPVEAAASRRGPMLCPMRSPKTGAITKLAWRMQFLILEPEEKYEKKRESLLGNEGKSLEEASGGDQAEPDDLLGVEGGEGDGDASSHGEAQEVKLIPFQVFHQVLQLGKVKIFAIGAVWSLGISPPIQI